MKIDLGNNRAAPVARAAAVDEGMSIKHVDPVRAARECNKIIANIEGCETVAEINAYMEEESVSIDALYLFDSALSERIDTTARDCRIFVSAGSPPASNSGTEPDSGAPVLRTPQLRKDSKMFAIDTGSETSSQGPWFTWTSEGSARKGLAPESWVLRYKDEGDTEWQNEAVPAFVNGCVMDLDSLKLGWEKDGGKGVAPERRWNPSIAQSTARPDDSKKPGGGYVWGKALSVRCAIGGGKAATWEQASFGAYEAFTKLAAQIQAQYPGDNTLPLVKQTGVDRKTLPNGSTSIPILTIEKWVPRPDCLKADAPVIATTPAPTPQAAAPTPPPPNTPAPAGTDEIAF